MKEYQIELLESRLGERLHFYSQIDSTNEGALQLGRQGAAHGSIVLAEEQFAGRGRRGASWFSGSGEGLAFSLLLRPACERILWPRLSLVAGLAVARSIEAAGLAAEIKWPNDVLVHGRKVCGILVEAENDFVVVGIGLNVGTREFPLELRESATSLAKEGGQGREREDYLLALVVELDFLQQQISQGFPDLLAEVRTRCALAGKRIEFREGQEALTGWCEGIGDGGELLVRENSVLQKHVAAEQIRILPD